MKREYIRILVYVVFAVFSIYILFSFVDIHTFFLLLGRVNWKYIFLCVLLSTVSSILLTWRLKLLLDPIDRVPFLFLWASGFATGLISLISSFSLGGLLLPYLISKKAKISYVYTFVVLSFLYLLSLLQIFLQSFLAIGFFIQKRVITIKLTTVSFPYTLIFVAFVIVGLALLFLLPRLYRRFQFKAFFQIPRELVALRFQTIFWQLVFVTIAITVLGLGEFYFYFVSLGVYPKILDLIFATSLLNLLGLLPGLPLKIGQYEALGVLTLPYLLHLDKSNVFTILILQHTVSIVSLLFLGLVSLYLLKIDKNIFEGLKAFKGKIVDLR